MKMYLHTTHINEPVRIDVYCSDITFGFPVFTEKSIQTPFKQ